MVKPGQMVDSQRTFVHPIYIAKPDQIGTLVEKLDLRKQLDGRFLMSSLSIGSSFFHKCLNLIRFRNIYIAKPDQITHFYKKRLSKKNWTMKNTCPAFSWDPAFSQVSNLIWLRNKWIPLQKIEKRVF